MSEASDLRTALTDPLNGANVYLVLLDRGEDTAALDAVEADANKVITTLDNPLFSLVRVTDPQTLDADDAVLGTLICAGDATVDAVVLGMGDGLARDKKTYTLADLGDAITITGAFANGATL
jgi:hypothetical protein